MVQCMIAEVNMSPSFMLLWLTTVSAAGASLCGLLYMLMRFYRIRQREQTRREIAAYVAEGSITPSDGEKLMRAASFDPQSAHGPRVVVGKAEIKEA